MADDVMPTRDLCPGLRFINDGDRWRLEAENVDVLRRLLGESVLAGLVRCFAVADRLASIADLMSLNYEHVGGDTIRGERNLHTLGMFANGLVYELAEALDDFGSKSDIRRRLSPEGIVRWEQLARFATLEHRSIAGKFRNLLAFHSGDLSVVRRGIRELQRDPARPVVILAADGLLKVSARHDIGTDIIMAGIRVVADESLAEDDPQRYRPLAEEDLRRVFTEIRDGHLTVLRFLDEVLLDALRHGGAALDPLLPLPADSDATRGLA